MDYPEGMACFDQLTLETQLSTLILRGETHTRRKMVTEHLQNQR